MERPPSKGTQVDAAKCIELYNKGMSLGEVGRIMGHAHSVIKYNLVRNGIAIRSQRASQRKPIQNNEIMSLYEDGMSAVEIAKHFNVTYQCIYDRLAEAKITPRNRRDQIRMMIKRGTYNVRSGEDHPLWKGGITTDVHGYVHRKVDNGKYVQEHRLVWEASNGPIPDGWVVHHINGRKKDNRIENLIAVPRKQHSPLDVVKPYQKRIRKLEKEIEELKKRV